MKIGGFNLNFYDQFGRPLLIVKIAEKLLRAGQASRTIDAQSLVKSRDQEEQTYLSGFDDIFKRIETIVALGIRDEQGPFVANFDKTGNATAWRGIHCLRATGAGDDDKRGKLYKSLAMNIKCRELFFDNALFGDWVDGAELLVSFNVHGGSLGG